MKKLVAIFVIGMFTLGAGDGCDQKHKPSAFKIEPVAERPVTEPKTEVVRYDLSTITMIGNHSYIPINLENTCPADHINEILGLLNEFEIQHPELEITNWHIEKSQDTHYQQARIDGLWIDHRPKS